MTLLRLSRAAEALSKMAEPAPVLPGALADEPLEAVPHGTQGRLLRPSVGGVGLKTTQGPRAYGPRLKLPGT